MGVKMTHKATSMQNRLPYEKLLIITITLFAKRMPI